MEAAAAPTDEALIQRLDEHQPRGPGPSELALDIKPFGLDATFVPDLGMG